MKYYPPKKKPLNYFERQQKKLHPKKYHYYFFDYMYYCGEKWSEKGKRSKDERNDCTLFILELFALSCHCVCTFLRFQ